MSIDAIKYTKSAAVERAREMLKHLHDRNQRTWDDLDRDVAFAIEALIASAERYRFIANKMQAEQAQPVAWLYPGSETEAKHVCLDEDIFEEQKPNCIPLYTAPPQRQWQGLTGEERFDLAIQTGAMTSDWLPFMEAVEAKLKTKNL
jgi:hypothetical protein